MANYSAAEAIQAIPENIYLFLKNVFTSLLLSLCVDSAAIALESETDKVTVYQQLSAAKSINDLSVKFRESLVNGQRESFLEILFDSGMEKADVEDYLKYLCPERGKANQVSMMSRIDKYSPLDKADPLFYQQINDIPKRFLIMPTHILRVIIIHDDNSIPREIWAPLAIDHRGIVIVGYKDYANYKVEAKSSLKIPFTQP
jgi:hypothetical protein